MRWRWLLFDFIPPHLGLSREERRVVRRRAQRLRPWQESHEANRRAGKLFMVFHLPAMSLFMLASMLSPLVGLSASILGLCVFALSAWVGWSYARGKTHGVFIYRALRELGFPTCCPECGYLLDGLDDRFVRCPECGWCDGDGSGSELSSP